MDTKCLSKKRLIPLVALVALGLGGCVAVPAYDPYPYYAAPAPVVVRPAVSFGYYSGPRGYYGHRHWR